MRKRYLPLLLALAVLFAGGPRGAMAEEPPRFGSFGEAVDAAGEHPALGGNSEYMAVVLEKDGRYYRAVAWLDDRARELDEASLLAGDFRADVHAFFDHVWSLPVSYVEVFTARPKEQAELDALAGKTAGELEEAGYIAVSSFPAPEEGRIVFRMSDGLYEYEFTAEGDAARYAELQEEDALHGLPLAGGRFAGLSPFATDLRYRADGEVEPEEDPFAEIPWLQAIDEAYGDGASAGDVDREALVRSLTEAYPEDAELITQIVDTYWADW